MPEEKALAVFPGFSCRFPIQKIAQDQRRLNWLTNSKTIEKDALYDSPS
jgi:hypothetical protein